MDIKSTNHLAGEQLCKNPEFVTRRDHQEDGIWHNMRHPRPSPATFDTEWNAGRNVLSQFVFNFRSAKFRIKVITEMCDCGIQASVGDPC